MPDGGHSKSGVSRLKQTKKAKKTKRRKMRGRNK
jgi:hypothetical protein